VTSKREDTPVPTAPPNRDVASGTPESKGTRGSPIDLRSPEHSIYSIKQFLLTLRSVNANTIT
jgi:hypothetical protein